MSFLERISLQPGPCEPAPGAGADPAGGSAARNVNVRVGGTVAEGSSTARLTSINLDDLFQKEFWRGRHGKHYHRIL